MTQAQEQPKAKKSKVHRLIEDILNVIRDAYPHPIHVADIARILKVKDGSVRMSLTAYLRGKNTSVASPSPRLYTWTGDVPDEKTDPDADKRADREAAAEKLGDVSYKYDVLRKHLLYQHSYGNALVMSDARAKKVHDERHRLFETKLSHSVDDWSGTEEATVMGALGPGRTNFDTELHRKMPGVTDAGHDLINKAAGEVSPGWDTPTTPYSMRVLAMLETGQAILQDHNKDVWMAVRL